MFGLGIPQTRLEDLDIKIHLSRIFFRLMQL